MFEKLINMISSLFKTSKDSSEISIDYSEIEGIAIYPSEGNIVKYNSSFMLDYTNKDEGYVIGTYLGNDGKKCKVRITHSGDGFNFSAFLGKSMVYPLTYGDGKYKIEIFQQTEGTKYRIIMSLTITVVLRDKLLPNLYPNTYVNYTENSKCVAKAQDICIGLKTDVQKSKAIYDWICNNIKYDFKKAVILIDQPDASHWFVPDPDEVLQEGKCICFGYASLFAAMHRCLGIPCRIAIGNVDGGGRHAWNEVYWSTSGSINKHLDIPAKKFKTIDVTSDISRGSRAIADLINNNKYVTEYRG